MKTQIKDQKSTQIVALGASAGGLKAIGDFFDHIPPKSGLTFVIILHRVKSKNKSHGLEYYLLAHSQMPVIEIVDGLKPMPNKIYIASNEKAAIIVEGVFKTIPLGNSVQRKDIDIFFESLAESKHQNAIAVVCSGRLCDGSKGLRKVKKYNGTTIAQDPQSALYPSMPRNAIDTGEVDYIFPMDRLAFFILQKFGNFEQFYMDSQTREDNLISIFGNLECLLKNLDRPILVLDFGLKIVGFGGTIQDILPVINTDIGRPVTDLQLRLDYHSLKSDVQEVFRSSRTKERLVTGTGGKPYMVRIAKNDNSPNLAIGGTLSFISLESTVNNTEKSYELNRVVPYGIVMAHVDKDLRYSWIFDPHPDFISKNVIGKRDDEIAQNDGIFNLIALKKRVMDSGMSEEKVINFPLSNGFIPYRISASAIQNILGQVVGVSTIGVELAQPK